MGAFLNNNTGLIVVSAILLIATLVLTAIGWSLRSAGLSLRPVVFIGVFFGIILVPQLLAHGVMALRPKAKPMLNEGAIAGRGDVYAAGADLWSRYRSIAFARCPTGIPGSAWQCGGRAASDSRQWRD